MDRMYNAYITEISSYVELLVTMSLSSISFCLKLPGHKMTTLFQRREDE